MDPIALIVVSLLVLVLLFGLGMVALRAGRSRAKPPSSPSAPSMPLPGVGDDATAPRDTPKRTIATVRLPDDPGADRGADPAADSGADSAADLAIVDRPAPVAGRMARLRDRLARSGGLGRGIVAKLSRSTVDESTWEEIEDALIAADVGVTIAGELVESLRAAVRAEPDVAPSVLLRAELLDLLDIDVDRSLTVEAAGRPAVVLLVGVNGTGKTTTTGKLARVLVAEDRDVMLAAADTFRAAAADQLQTWGDRVGVPVIRGPEGGDPASVVFDAVTAAIDAEAGVLLVDTAGRLHTKTGLMDELGKVKRVIEKKVPVDEVLLVLDATTGQNGMAQAKVFAEVVDVTGVVLTKLDGTAKGGIVVAVQRELGVPVKLVGLGEGPDDLAPFEPEIFVDALMG